MTAFRLTLDLDEQTRARWQNAAHRYGWTLDEWVRDVCATASDPDAGQVVDCRARLTTAETERSEAVEEATALHSQVTDLALALLEAEGAVVALTAMLHGEGYLQTDIDHDVRLRIRAALACPPQQRGEK